MQRLLTFAAMLCVATSPGAQQQAAPGAYTLRVSAERVAQCEAQGGCALVTRDELVQAIAEAIEAGRREAQGDCRRLKYRT